MFLTRRHRTQPLHRRQCLQAMLAATAGRIALPCGQDAAVAESPSSRALNTGSDAESFEQRLWNPSSFFWEDVPLASGLQRLQQTQQIVVWQDRRLDPSRATSAKVPNMPFWQAIDSFAQQNDLTVAWAEGVIYVGPPKRLAGQNANASGGSNATEDRAEIGESEASVDVANHWASALRNHQHSIDRLAPSLQQPWRQELPLSWNRLTRPTDIVHDFIAQTGLRVQNLSKLPHDLWRSRELPPLPSYLLLGLIVSGFGLTYKIQADGTASLFPFPRQVLFNQDYRIDRSLLADVRRLLQDRQIRLERRSSNQWTVRADWRTHFEIESMLRQPQAAPNDPKNVRYSLRGKNQPVGPFVKQLASQMGLECEFDSGLESQLETRVTFEVNQVTRDELFRAILNPTGLIAAIRDGVLHVSAD